MMTFLLRSKAARVVLVLIIMAGLIGGARFMARTAGEKEGTPKASSNPEPESYPKR